MSLRALLFGCTMMTLSPAWAAESDASAEQRIPTAPSITAPCLSVRATETVSVSISVPMSVIERLMAERPSDETAYDAESARMAKLHGDRARLLSTVKSDSIDALGCRSIVSEQLEDATYLIGHLLDTGQATVSVAGRSQPEAAIWAEETTCQFAPMGTRTYRLDDGKPFFFFTTCIV